MKKLRRILLPATAAFAVALAVPVSPAAAAVPDPAPIPGGFVPFPGAPFIHVFVPGPTELGLMGENVEPSTITDFDGFTALAYVNGTATDADGNTYTMLTDIRVISGTYVALDGSVNQATFAFI